MALDPIDFVRSNICIFTDKDAPGEEKLKRINYVLRSNGLWEVRKNSIATFYKHLSDHELLGFNKKDEWEEGFLMHVPKIPKDLLDQTIAFFSAISRKIKAEAYVQYIYNTDTKEYKIVCPKQEVSGARVSYHPTPLESNELLVCEIHSHNTMGAFFSSVDDTDERSRGDRFFGVIGRLDQITPEMKMSFICGGRERVILDMHHVFDIPPLSTFPAEWLTSVVETKTTIAKTTGHQKWHNDGVLFSKFIDEDTSSTDTADFTKGQEARLDAMLAEEIEQRNFDDNSESYDAWFYNKPARPKASKPKPKTILRTKGK